MDLDQLLQKFGFNSETTTAFRFGQGVMGKTTIAFVSLMGVIGLCAFKLNSDLFIFITILLALAVFILFLIGNFYFAHKNPMASILDGADYVAVKKIEATAQGMTSIPHDDVLVQQNESLRLGGPE